MVAKLYKGFDAGASQRGRSAGPSAVVSNTTGEALNSFLQKAGGFAANAGKAYREEKILEARSAIGAKGVENFQGQNFAQADKWTKMLVSQQRAKTGVEAFSNAIANTDEYDSMSPEDFYTAYSQRMGIAKTDVLSENGEPDDGTIEKAFSNVLYDANPMLAAQQAQKHHQFNVTNATTAFRQALSENKDNPDEIIGALDKADQQGILSEPQMAKAMFDVVVQANSNGEYNEALFNEMKVQGLKAKFPELYAKTEKVVQKGYQDQYIAGREDHTVAILRKSNAGQLTQQDRVDFESLWDNKTFNNKQWASMLAHSVSSKVANTRYPANLSNYKAGIFVTNAADNTKAQQQVTEEWFAGGHTDDSYATLLNTHGGNPPATLARLVVSALTGVNGGSEKLTEAQVKGFNVMRFLDPSIQTKITIGNPTAAATWAILKDSEDYAGDLTSKFKAIQQMQKTVGAGNRTEVTASINRATREYDGENGEGLIGAFGEALKNAQGRNHFYGRDSVSFNPHVVSAAVSKRRQNYVLQQGLSIEKATELAINDEVESYETLDGKASKKIGGRTSGERWGYPGRSAEMIALVKENFTTSLTEAFPGVDLEGLDFEVVEGGLQFFTGPGGRYQDKFPVSNTQLQEMFAFEAEYSDTMKGINDHRHQLMRENQAIEKYAMLLENRARAGSGIGGMSQQGVNYDTLNEFNAMEPNDQLAIIGQKKAESAKRWTDYISSANEAADFGKGLSQK
jgi:hypothetical protein